MRVLGFHNLANRTPFACMINFLIRVVIIMGDGFFQSFVVTCNPLVLGTALSMRFSIVVASVFFTFMSRI